MSSHIMDKVLGSFTFGCLGDLFELKNMLLTEQPRPVHFALSVGRSVASKNDIVESERTGGGRLLQKSRLQCPWMDASTCFRSLPMSTKQSNHRIVTMGAIQNITSAACPSLPDTTSTSLICACTASHEPHGTIVGENTAKRTAMTMRLQVVLAKHRCRSRRPEDTDVRVDRCSSRSVEGRRVAWCTAMQEKAKAATHISEGGSHMRMRDSDDGCTEATQPISATTSNRRS